MAFILKEAIWASLLVTQGTKTIVGDKIQIAAGMAIEMGTTIPLRPQSRSASMAKDTSQTSLFLKKQFDLGN